MKFRQVHLDFHTSEHIKDIGKEFDKKQFQTALISGHVDSITIFSKCHHGWSYHKTQVNEIHPELTFDLLAEQLEACKEIGVSSPVYISAGLDEKEAIRHPEWLARAEDESNPWVANFIHGAGFHLLCFNTTYLDLLEAQTAEVMQRYKPNGIFLDIASIHPCYCANCRNEMIQKKKDPRDIDAVMEQAELVYQRYAERMERVIKKYNGDCTIFHNAGHITRGRRDIAGYNTHLELESLPTGGWGYDHFPMSASYVMNLGQEYLGMTGKFHNTWGEFGGYKHPNALIYETSLALAFGAKSSIGDQLHPLGKMNEATYGLIGAAYKEVELKEEWCLNSVNCFDIGILSEEAVNHSVSNRDVQWHGDIGANRIMLEGKYLYRIIDTEVEFQDYPLIILPDNIRLSEDLRKRLQKYLENGGKILATGSSGLSSDKDTFTLDMGVKFIGKSEYKPDYLIPLFPLVTGRDAHVMYEDAYRIEQLGGTEFARRENSYFNRDILHFCSHQQTPNNSKESFPAAVITKNTAYISWNIFTDYAKMGSLHLKETICYALDTLLGEKKTIEANLPDKAIVTLTKQKDQGRYINHVLFAHTMGRGSFLSDGKMHAIEVIEDIVPLYNKSVILRIQEKVNRVYLAPQMEDIEFREVDSGIEYLIPKVNCHQMVVIDVETIETA
ncbi:beta-galactosidase trimerization domain-containing protein [Lachnospiraceae bacterium ZAX-1]